ncbi:FadD3 family acyl-CoA ligase [Sphingomonas montanisoli]|uniref:3-methylmercaptopropionyl-CoA ligase n=1 Tax=Sphingomonas montanisoli TaxID=2606412 RepID=A0A5D9CDI1_9SPHN|nr:FadD3 family acyl-CoA ligase [Sphingomonas montanisoli]TZG29387.1 AMP-binding protein [Sphingomonas montanisoli]
MDCPTIPHVALESARTYGDKIVISTPGGEAIGYAELARRMEAAARAFIAAGVKRGDRVAIWAPNLDRWIVATLGLQAAGAAVVPLNTRYKGREAAYILKKSRARILLTVGNFLGNDYPAMIAGEDVPCLERVVLLDDDEAPNGWAAFLKEGEGVSREAYEERLGSLDGEDVCDILFTSGTTGNPKGVVTTHGQNIRCYDIYSRGLGLTSADRLLSINPFFHSFGYKAGWLCAILRGATLFPVLSFDPAKAVDMLEEHKISWLPGPPTIFTSLLDSPREGRDLSSLRLAVTGATTVPTVLIQRILDDLGFDRVVTAYGLSETCGTVSMCEPDDDIETIAHTSGRAIPDMEVRTVGVDGRDVPAGEPGEIWVRGPNVMRGYLDDPVGTAEAIVEGGWLRTGDIGVMRADGCISITDRAKDMFICGGFNVYPAEIEQILIQHPEVAEVTVVGAPDDRLGEVGHAYIVARPGAAKDAKALIGWSRDNMANYKVPRTISFVEALPRNASGKVEKFKLRDAG